MREEAGKWRCLQWKLRQDEKESEHGGKKGMKARESSEKSMA